MGEDGFALNYSVEKLVSENSLFLFSHSAVKISTLEPELNVMAFFLLCVMAQVSANLLDNLQRYTVPHNLYQGFLQQELNCTFSVHDTMETLLELCKNNIDAWFWSGVLILLSFSAVLMAFQVTSLHTQTH